MAIPLQSAFIPIIQPWNAWIITKWLPRNYWQKNVMENYEKLAFLAMNMKCNSSAADFMMELPVPL